MSSTLTNLLCHVVFSTKHRRPLITDNLRNDLYNYMGGIIKNEGGILLEIGGISDHVHLLLKLKPVHSVSDIMRKVKGGSSKWINEQHKTNERFSWQDGYGAFSVSESQVNHVVQYIKTQAQHHQKLSFQDEFVLLLKRHGVTYEEKYLWN